MQMEANGSKREVFALLALAAIATAAIAIACNESRKRAEWAIGLQVERFGAEAAKSASVWMREGVLSLGSVPSLQLPGVGSPVADIQYVAPVKSVVWRDMLAPDRDGLFVEMTEHSMADLVVNRKHPYARFLVDFDTLLLELRTAGRQNALRALSASSPRELEARVFASVAEQTNGERVFTLSPEFAKGGSAARSMYDMLFSVATLRACFVNGTAIDAIMKALSDHEATVARHKQELARARATAASDARRTGDFLMGKMATSRSRMAEEVASSAATVARLNSAHSEARIKGAEVVSKHAALNAALQNQATTLHELATETAEAKAALEGSRLERGALRPRLDSAIRLANASSSQRQADRTAQDAELRNASTAAARFREAADRASSQLRVADVANAAARGVLASARDHRNASSAKAEAHEAGISSARTETQDLGSQVARERERANDLQTRSAQVAAERGRLLEAARSVKDASDARLRRAMDANAEAQDSYALWDKYASLTRLADEIDANDDGLPTGKVAPAAATAPAPTAAPAPEPEPPRWRDSTGGYPLFPTNSFIRNKYLDSKRSVENAISECRIDCARAGCTTLTLYNPKRGNHECRIFRDNPVAFEQLPDWMKDGRLFTSTIS